MSLEKMVKRFVSGIIVGAGLYTAGCGTTLHTQKGEVWYDCNTSKDYPQGHPCYAKVENYKRQQQAIVVSSPSSSTDRIGDRDFGHRAAGERRSRSGGTYKCRR